MNGAVPVVRSVLALLSGYVTLAIVLMVMFVVWFPDPGATSDGSPGAGFMAVSAVYGMVAAFAGGWVALLVARRDGVQHALALAAVAVIVWLLSLKGGPGGEAFWYQATNLAGTVAGVLAAGLLWAYMARRFAAGASR